MIEWQWLAFDEIPRRDWYEVLRQRQQVFILKHTLAGWCDSMQSGWQYHPWQTNQQLGFAVAQ